MQRAVLQCIFAANARPNDDLRRESSAAGVMDTILRSLYLAGNADKLLTSHVDAYCAALQAAPDFSGCDKNEATALAESLRPPSSDQDTEARIPFLEWPIPAVNLERFESHVGSLLPTRHGRSRETDGQAVLPCNMYGRGSRFQFQQMRAAALQLREDPARFRSATAPALATVVTCSMVDAYWAGLYASCDSAFVERVLDVGTLYVPFFEEFGDEWVARYDPGAGPDAPFSGVPPSLRESPLEAMRFEASRYALWSLLVNASTHTVVAGMFRKHADSVTQAAGAAQALSGGPRMTAFGRQRLRLLELLAPAMEQMSARAEAHGIGSGHYPPSFDLRELPPELA